MYKYAQKKIILPLPKKFDTFKILFFLILFVILL